MVKDKNFTFDLSTKGLKIEIEESFGNIKLELPPDVAKVFLAGPISIRERLVKEQFADPISDMVKILCAITHMSATYPDGAYAIYPMMRSLLVGLFHACKNLMDVADRKSRIPQNPRGNA